jgi:hypothetical protein
VSADLAEVVGPTRSGLLVLGFHLGLVQLG